MAEFDEDQHPRGEGGKFAEAGGSAHVSAASRSGDHAKQQSAHEQAAAKAKDPATRAQHQAQAANHAGQAAREGEAHAGLASFAAKHAGGGEHGHDDGHAAAGHGDAPGGAKHEEGHGLGAWVAHHLDEAKEGVEEKGEELRELEEKALEGDVFKAAEAVAGAAGHAAAAPAHGIAAKLEGKEEHGDKPHGHH